MPVSKEIAAQFLAQIQQEVKSLEGNLATEKGDWIVKGFIDVFRNVYTIPSDTKVVSKVMEILLFPYIASFASKVGYRMVLSPEQNYYPDVSFVDKDGHKIALDIKTTYLKESDVVSTMTLGSFTGYFRNRSSSKNTTFRYSEYSAHLVLGVIYSRSVETANHKMVYSLDEIEAIPSVVRNIRLFVQPKYRIASDKPGSGNTKNIGAIDKVPDLLSGNGPFAKLGEEVFDDYWMHYMTADMARALELEKPPYHNLQTYLEYKKLPTGRQE